MPIARGLVGVHEGTTHVDITPFLLVLLSRNQEALRPNPPFGIPHRLGGSNRSTLASQHMLEEVIRIGWGELRSTLTSQPMVEVNLGGGS